MRILFIVPYVPNLIRVRPYNLIRYLSKRGHQITLMTLWSTEQDKKDLERISPLCSDVIFYHLSRWRSLFNSFMTLPTGLPLQSRYCLEPRLVNQVKRSVDHLSNTHYDIVHVEHLRGVRYGLELLQGSIPVIWDSVDCISHLFEQSSRQSSKRSLRYLTRFDLSRTRNYEQRMLEKFSRILVTSKVDQQAFFALHRDSHPQAEVTVLPNGVDLQYFSADPGVERDPFTLVLTGKMSYHANITMALHLVNDILPIIWRNCPDVKLWIVGKDPSQEVMELSGHPNITVTGTVEDIRPYLQKAGVAVAPISYGAGIQNKVLEAMACGTPVICSPQAVSALSVQQGQDVIVAGSPNEFANAVLALVNDPDRQRQIGNGGLEFVQKNHDWNEIAAQLDRIYRIEIDRKFLIGVK